jgi:hypothetical protein
MAVLVALLHVMGLVAPAVGVALLASGLAKAWWRHELADVAWSRLFGACALAQTLVILGGLVWTGRDGKMATYLAMLLAGASALWWVGFASRRRRG